MIWSVLACVVIVPLFVAAGSPFLGARAAVYIIASMAGIVAMCLLLVQPLLAAGYLPGLRPLEARRWHRWLGSGLAIAVLLHIGGLYLTSPQDALDALLLVSPTPFSVYGVIGLWSLVLTVLLVAARSRMGLAITSWRIVHNGVAAVVVVSSVVHALMIEGTMGYWSKLVLCICVLGASAVTIVHLRFVKPMRKKR